MTTQAERNAQNALDAARLARVEAGVRAVLARIAAWQATSWQPVLEVVADGLTEALRAPAERT